MTLLGITVFFLVTVKSLIKKEVSKIRVGQRTLVNAIEIKMYMETI